ncbi:MAG: antitoxin VbhA family protein [Flavobacteriaceae bacterium]|nr:antitoxin VbhA family protein [Flavobacteriaceae bacterium]
MYKAIQIDRENLTIMGVVFPDLETLNSTANALGSNMFEGFKPTKKIIQIYLDLKMGKITNVQLIKSLREAI